MEPIRVLVVDDSPSDQETLARMLQADDVRVIDRAGDGEAGLQKALAEAPDVITLDLEMPRMDGFTLLRVLMSRRPTAVIVVSSHAARGNVFRALELGALDFIAKPVRQSADEIAAIRDDLLRKVRIVGRLRRLPIPPQVAPGLEVRAAGQQAPPRRLLVVVASTGGPPAVQDLLGALGERLRPCAALVAQPMPPGFPEAFADRLAEKLPLDVREASDGEPLLSGQVRVGPGRAHLEVAHAGEGWQVRLAPAPADAESPAPGRLLASAAAAAGGRLVAVVLTGGAADVGAGVRAVREAGGRVIAQSPDTALVGDLCAEAIAAGAEEVSARSLAATVAEALGD